MKKIITLTILLVLSVNTMAQQTRILENRTYPFTLAYCLDGKVMDYNTKEITWQDPTLGYITFYGDKIVVDNETTYKLVETNEGVRTYEAPPLYMQDLKCVSQLAVQESTGVILLMHFPQLNTFKFIPLFLMEVSDFMALWNRNNGISSNNFIQESQGGANTSEPTHPNSYKGSSSYFRDKYGYKDCHICRGSGICQTCNGKGYYSSPYGSGNIKCPNCLHNGTGKCSTCQGTGKVFGLK